MCAQNNNANNTNDVISNNSSQKKLKNWVVGSAKKKYFTFRDVQIDYILENVLFSKKQFSLSNLIISKDDSNLNEKVNSLLFEVVVDLEAQYFQEAITQELINIKQKKEIFYKKIKDWDYWIKSLEVEDEELTKMLLRKIRTKKFIEFKIDSFTLPVTDLQAKEYFESNKGKFLKMPFYNFKESIKNYLRQIYRDNRLKEWFLMLKKKYKIHTFNLKI